MWFPISLLFLGINLASLYRGNILSKPIFTEYSNTTSFSKISARKITTQSGKILGVSISAADSRLLILQKFLQDSPLFPYAQKLVDNADTYSIDFRLVPAIAMCESNLGKRIPTADSHNAFGIAVYTGQQEGAKFENWDVALDWIFEFIHNKFISQDITDIRKIGGIWAPPSLETDNSWARCVETFMRQIE